MSARIPLPDELQNRSFTTQEALTLGVGRGRLAGRDITSPFRGVHLSASGSASLEELCRGLSRRVGPRAFFAGITAAKLWDAPLPRWCDDERVVVAIRGGTAPVGRGVRGRALAMPDDDITFLGDLPLTTPSRTWLDLASDLSLPDLVAVGDFFIHHRHPLTSRDALITRVADGVGRRGIRVARVAIELLSERSESRKETHLRVLLTSHGIGPLEANYWVVTSSSHRYRLDLADVAHKIAFEYQSAFHHDPERQQADMVRRSRLQADGWIVIEVSQWDLNNPSDLIARVRATLAQR